MFNNVQATCEIIAKVYLTLYREALWLENQSKFNGDPNDLNQATSYLNNQSRFSDEDNDLIGRCLYTGWYKDTLKRGIDYTELALFIEGQSKVPLYTHDGTSSEYIEAKATESACSLDADLFRYEVINYYSRRADNEIQYRFIPAKILSKYTAPLRVTANNYCASGCMTIFEEDDGSLRFGLWLKDSNYYDENPFGFMAYDVIKILDHEEGGGHSSTGGGNLKEDLISSATISQFDRLGDSEETEELSPDRQNEQAQEELDNIRSNYNTFLVYKTLLDISKILERDIANDDKITAISDELLKLSQENLDTLNQIIENMDSSFSTFKNNVLVDFVCNTLMPRLVYRGYFYPFENRWDD